MIGFDSRGSFRNTERFLARMLKGDIFAQLEAAGARGVLALASATPVDTGISAQSWTYEVRRGPSGWTIAWLNTHTVAGTPLVILLQYGHGTGTGGYVQGRDFINPAIRPIFDQIANDVWKVVTSA